MSFTEILEELPKLTSDERQELARQALAFDEDTLTAEEDALLDERLAEYARDPGACVSLEEFEEIVLRHIQAK